LGCTFAGNAAKTAAGLAFAASASVFEPLGKIRIEVKQGESRELMDILMGECGKLLVYSRKKSKFKVSFTHKSCHFKQSS
jgi:hypothetical protein